MSSNSNSHAVNSINLNRSNPPGLIKARIKTAPVIDGKCYKCGSDRENHTSLVQTYKTCNMSYFCLCDKFFHTPRVFNLKKGSVNTIQGLVATLS